MRERQDGYRIAHKFEDRARIHVVVAQLFSLEVVAVAGCGTYKSWLSGCVKYKAIRFACI